MFTVFEQSYHLKFNIWIRLFSQKSISRSKSFIYVYHLTSNKSLMYLNQSDDDDLILTSEYLLLITKMFSNFHQQFAKHILVYYV